MKKISLITITYAIFFLFLLQSIGSLVESIYILDLLKTSLDEKALGLLFFFAPGLLFFLPKKNSKAFIWVLFGLLFLGRGCLPYLSTLGRMIAGGVASAAGLLLFPFLLTAQTDPTHDSQRGKSIAMGFALALLGLVLFRTLDYSLDYSLQSEGSWIGWVLGIVLGLSLRYFSWQEDEVNEKPHPGLNLTMVGIFMAISLDLFAFSAPSVMARWTESDYRMIVITVSLITTLWMLMVIYRPGLPERIPSWGIFLWNSLLTLTLTGTLLVQRVPFPPTPTSPPVVMSSSSALAQVLLFLSILLFPVIFLDLQLLVDRIQPSHTCPRDLTAGMLLGAFLFILLVFMQIFTNVWGYIEPVSPWFRNKFWLPFLVMSALLMLIVGRRTKLQKQEGKFYDMSEKLGWTILLGVLFLGCGVAAFLTTPMPSFLPPTGPLVVMTYNIQQGNDVFGERSLKRQLALIEKVSPDILALQESDSARVSLNNIDIVRYFAGRLGYYSYYGPSPVSGSYGTALLSKYPLRNTRVIYSYSDKDEIGTSVVEIVLNDTVFTIYDVHPDGTDLAMEVFAQTLLEQVDNKEYVIALGDYNLRDYEYPYQLIAERLTNVWESLYPSKISPDGTDMSGENRIDHIFISTPLKARQAWYILPPDSATDHPVHWAEIDWER